MRKATAVINVLENVEPMQSKRMQNTEAQQVV